MPCCLARSPSSINEKWHEYQQCRDCYQPLSCKQANLEVPSLVSFPKRTITFLSFFFFSFYLLI